MMTSRMLSRLCTLSPGNTSFITVSFPSCTAQILLLFTAPSPWCPHPIPCPHSVPILSPSPHRLGEEQLQLAVLQHVDAGVGLPGSEHIIPLLTLLENHVLAELQKQRLLKVSQHPAGMGTAGDTALMAAAPKCHLASRCYSNSGGRARSIRDPAPKKRL